MGSRSGDLEKRRNRVAHQIQVYIEHVWPYLERGGFDHETPMNRKSKGESNSPIPESAIALMDANRKVADLIRTDLEALEASPANHGGVEFREIIGAIRQDPGAIRKWRRGETEEDGVKVVSLWKMCQLVAQVLMQRDPFADDGFRVETSVAKAMEEEEDLSTEVA